MSESESKKFSLKSCSKGFTIVLIVILMVAVLYIFFGKNLMSGTIGAQSVKFTQLEAENIPQSIEKDVIPEYRTLERALGCLVDGKVYVVVTRGEKPTAGYDLIIEKMSLEKTDMGKNLIVSALFTEPNQEETVSRVITYPYVVAETDLAELPNTIELQVKYAE